MSFDLDNPKTWPELGRLDPDLKNILETSEVAFKKEPDIDTIVSTREAWFPKYKAVADSALESHKGRVVYKEVQLPRRDGSSSRALLYSPADKLPRPLVVLIHGGGFCFGCPEMEGANCVRAVASFGCVALSLSYRLAPEHRFPTATNDCLDALDWITTHPHELGADLAQGFVLGGSSAGGNIASVLAHELQDRGHGSLLTGLWLNVPLLLAPEAVGPDHQELYRSREQNSLAPILNKAFMDMYTQAYAPPDLNSHVWSPLNWPSGHDKHPPTYFQICGLDVLRDEALIYDRILRREYSISTKVDLYPGLPHMFAPNFPTHPSSAKYAEDTNEGIGWLLTQTKHQGAYE